jgi:NADPH-dependent ferric siderophore reductase
MPDSNASSQAPSTAPDLTVQRVRHPLKMRMLQVARTQRVTPRLLRVTLVGDDLAGFTSASFDDHVKVFIPKPGEDRPVLPEVGPDGPIRTADGPRPIARDYTPRHFDPVAGELDLEFVLHGDGPATTWAAQARPGQFVGVGGPRGSFVIPEAFDWHLLIGDEAALPAVARRVEELPSGKRVIAVLLTDDAEGQVPLGSDADLDIHWLHRGAGTTDDGALFVKRLARIVLPAGQGYVWAAAESQAVRAVREHLVNERGIDKKRIRASSYWKRGDAGVHETLDD